MWYNITVLEALKRRNISYYNLATHSSYHTPGHAHFCNWYLDILPYSMYILLKGDRGLRESQDGDGR